VPAPERKRTFQEAARRGFVDRCGQKWRQSLEAAIDAEDTEVAG
jgi:hypothetical protein